MVYLSLFRVLGLLLMEAIKKLLALSILPTYVPYHSFQYDKIREALKDHFYFKYQRGEVLWPKKFTAKEKDTFSLTRAAIMERVNMEYERVLYSQASTLRGKDRSTGLYYLLLGDGLFSNIDYLKAMFFTYLI